MLDLINRNNQVYNDIDGTKFFNYDESKETVNLIITHITKRVNFIDSKLLEIKDNSTTTFGFSDGTPDSKFNSFREITLVSLKDTFPRSNEKVGRSRPFRLKPTFQKKFTNFNRNSVAANGHTSGISSVTQSNFYNRNRNQRNDSSQDHRNSNLSNHNNNTTGKTQTRSNNPNRFNP